MSQKGISAFYQEATSEKSTLRDNLYNSRLVFFKILNDMKNKKQSRSLLIKGKLRHDPLKAMRGPTLDPELGENTSDTGHHRTIDNPGIWSVGKSFVSVLNFLKTLMKEGKSLMIGPFIMPLPLYIGESKFGENIKYSFFPLHPHLGHEAQYGQHFTFPYHCPSMNWGFASFFMRLPVGREMMPGSSQSAACLNPAPWRFLHRDPGPDCICGNRSSIELSTQPN